MSGCRHKVRMDNAKMIETEKTIEKYGYDSNSLKKSSDKLCIVTCDYCQSIFERKYGKIIRGRKTTEKDACNKKECQTTKRKTVFKELYGVEHPSQSKKVQEKRKNTFIEKFGCENPFQNEQVKEKIRQTNKKRYGVSNPQQLKTIRKRSEETTMERYGVTYPIQSPGLKVKIYNTIEERYGVKHYGHLQRVNFEDIVSMSEKKNYKINFTEKCYKNKTQPLSYTCLKHGIDFETSLVALRLNEHQCPKCQIFKRSKAEIEISNLVESLSQGVELGNRKILNGKEIDVYVPKNNLAIEYHGLYHHCEIFKDRTYHYNKFIGCKADGILLVQVFEDEWRDKREICESIIRAKLGTIECRVPARKLKVIESDKLNENMFSSFFLANHLQGNTKFEKAFGLVDDNEDILCAISLRKPFTKKKDKVVEVARLATKLNTSVQGGFSRLMKGVKEWAKTEGYSTVLTYSDCRYSHGESYSNYGFNFVGHTGIGYDYTDFKDRFNRFKFRAQGGKSEKEVAEEYGIYKIYNAGNYRWELTL